MADLYSVLYGENYCSPSVVEGTSWMVGVKGVKYDFGLVILRLMRPWDIWLGWEKLIWLRGLSIFIPSIVFGLWHVELLNLRRIFL